MSLLEKELLRITHLTPVSPESTEEVPSAAILIDGFPRSVENFTEFEKHIFPARRLLVIECSEAEMIRRGTYR